MPRPAGADDPWPLIAQNAFDNRPLADGTDLLAIEMPYRAEDAAVVPVTVRSTLPPGDGRHFKSFTIVIDQNPAPIAAKFTMAADAGVASISTRVRVDSYTNVHAATNADTQIRADAENSSQSPAEAGLSPG